MEQKLREIIAKIAEVSPDFAADADLRDELDLDSHRAVEMVFEVEKEFSVTIPDNRYREMRSLTAIVSLVQSLKG
jgi:acyl carrier protein